MALDAKRSRATVSEKKDDKVSSTFSLDFSLEQTTVQGNSSQAEHGGPARWTIQRLEFKAGGV